MPSTSVFEEQSKTFKNNLLKSNSGETFIIEAGSTMYWNKYTKYENIFVKDLMKEWGAHLFPEDYKL